MGWSCTDKEMDAIARLSTGAWTAGIDQNGDVIEDTFVAEVTGLLDLDGSTAGTTRYLGCGSSCATSRATPATASGPPSGRNSSGAATVPADRREHP